MTAEHALLATILAAPADDTPRLVYADWLDEHGQGSRAEFIRVQIAIARLRRGEPTGKDPMYLAGMRSARDADMHTMALFLDQRCECGRCLSAREHDLLTANTATWTAEALPMLVGQWKLPPGFSQQFARFTRGFLSHLTMSAADWLECADRVYWHPGQDRPLPATAQSIETVTLTTWPDYFHETDGRWVDVPGESWDAGYSYEARVRTFEAKAMYRWPGIRFDLPHEEQQ